MKKILFVLLCAMTPCWATEMCVNDDTIVIALPTDGADTPKQGTNYNFNKNESTWWAQTSGVLRVYGDSTCPDALPEFIPKDANTVSGRYYNKNGELLPTGDEVKGIFGGTGNNAETTYCWCRITHPFKTAWYFVRGWGSGYCHGGQCADSCAGQFLSNTKIGNTNMRSLSLGAMDILWE